MDYTLLDQIFYSLVRKTYDFDNSKYALNKNNNNDDKKLYFNDDYKYLLIKHLKENNAYDAFKDYELDYFKKGRTKMCSLFSSSRLCFWYFLNKKKSDPSATYEDTSFTFIDDQGRKKCSHFDFSFNKGNTKTVYECKSTELLKKHNHLKDRKLIASSYKKLIKDLFDIKDEEIIEEHKELYPTLGNFKIIDEDHRPSTPIYEYYFEFKQFLTHLISLGNRDKNEFSKVNLVYLFFKPKGLDEYEEKYHKEDLNYLRRQVNLVFNSPVILSYCKKHNIELRWEEAIIDPALDLAFTNTDKNEISLFLDSQKEEASRLLKEGLDLINNKDNNNRYRYIDAYKLIKEAADLGYPSAIYNLGECYLKGYGVPIDYNEGIYLLTKAASLNERVAALELSEYYKNGTYVKQDLKN